MNNLREPSIFADQTINRFIESHCKSIMIIANNFSEDLNYIFKLKQWEFE